MLVNEIFKKYHINAAVTWNYYLIYQYLLSRSKGENEVTKAASDPLSFADLTVCSVSAQGVCGSADAVSGGLI